MLKRDPLLKNLNLALLGFFLTVFIAIPFAMGVTPGNVLSEVRAEEEEDDSDMAEDDPTNTIDTEELLEKIAELEKAVLDSGNKIDSLQKEIEYANNQIQLTQLRIQNTINQIAVKTEKIAKLGQDIVDLGNRIERMTESITYQENILAQRKRSYYKMEESTPSSFEFILFLLDPKKLEQKIDKTTYSEIMQEHDAKLLKEMNKTKTAYANQKNIFEDKKQEEEELKAEIVVQKANQEAYKRQLDDQKASKERLLKDTENDNAKYQELLEQARQEYLSLQAILAGSGIEGSGVNISAGQTIGSVIAGASCNSNGVHLHFTVRKNGATKDPFKYLKGISSYSNCSGSGSCSASDSFNPSGDWQWPLKGHITMHQGYGNTWATRNIPWLRNIYSFHDGIDISSPQLALYAVEDGIYYRGYYDTGQCRLQYIRLDHSGGLQSYYLHVNY